jgi:hypothetical protein
VINIDLGSGPHTFSSTLSNVPAGCKAFIVVLNAEGNEVQSNEQEF